MKTQIIEKKLQRTLKTMSLLRDIARQGIKYIRQASRKPGDRKATNSERIASVCNILVT